MSKVPTLRLALNLLFHAPSEYSPELCQVRIKRKEQKCRYADYKWTASGYTEYPERIHKQTYRCQNL